MSNLNGINKQLHDLVNSGSESVEQIHKSIANLPFELAENVEILATPARTLKELQNNMIGGVYSVIRMVNDRVSEFTDSIIEKTGK